MVKPVLMCNGERLKLKTL